MGCIRCGGQLETEEKDLVKKDGTPYHVTIIKCVTCDDTQFFKLKEYEKPKKDDFLHKFLSNQRK